MKDTLLWTSKIRSEHKLILSLELSLIALFTIEGHLSTFLIQSVIINFRLITSAPVKAVLLFIRDLTAFKIVVICCDVFELVKFSKLARNFRKSLTSRPK